MGRGDEYGTSYQYCRRSSAVLYRDAIRRGSSTASWGFAGLVVRWLFVGDVTLQRGCGWGRADGREKGLCEDSERMSCIRSGYWCAVSGLDAGCGGGL